MRRTVMVTGYFAAAILALTAPSAVLADDVRAHGNRFKATLNGFHENPSISTTGHGEFDLRIDDANEVIHFTLTYADIEGGGPNVAHIHFAAQHVNGGVSAFLCGGATKPEPCPPVSGTVSGEIRAADVVGPAGQGIEPMSFGELVRAIRAGFTYVNAHSTRWPAGEIRGQIVRGERKELQ